GDRPDARRRRGAHLSDQEGGAGQAARRARRLELSLMRIEIAAAELPGLLDRAPDQVSLLSLDCFDTLVWRDVQAPADIFAELPIPGGGAWARTRAEDKARKAARLAGRAEVTIRDIYRVLMPAAPDAQIAAAIEAELAAEHRHCFAF